MAVQVYTPPVPPAVAIAQFAKDLLDDIQFNFAMQQIWPYEIYPGYAKVNAMRFAKGKWYSTGEGAKSFEAQIHTNPGREAIVLRYNDYLRFVDMGVGQRTKWQQVHAESAARHDKRYISKWERREGESHRPAILAQTRRTAHRLINYFEDYFARESYFTVIKSMEGLTPATLFL